MKLQIILTLGLLVAHQLSAQEKVNAYDKTLSLRIVYSPDTGGAFSITLKNLTKSKMHLGLNTKEIEGDFTIQDDKDGKNSFCDKNYLRKRLTGVIFSGTCEVKANEEITWAVKLRDLVYVWSDKTVTQESLSGKAVGLTLNRVSVLQVGKQSIPLKLSSNVVRIPNIEQAPSNGDKPSN